MADRNRLESGRWQRCQPRVRIPPPLPGPRGRRQSSGWVRPASGRTAPSSSSRLARRPPEPLSEQVDADQQHPEDQPDDQAVDLGEHDLGQAEGGVGEHVRDRHHPGHPERARPPALAAARAQVDAPDEHRDAEQRLHRTRHGAEVLLAPVGARRRATGPRRGCRRRAAARRTPGPARAPRRRPGSPPGRGGRGRAGPAPSR